MQSYKESRFTREGNGTTQELEFLLQRRHVVRLDIDDEARTGLIFNHQQPARHHRSKEDALHITFKPWLALVRMDFQ